MIWFNARRYLGYDIGEWESLPWWQQDAYLDGMNQYFEWEVKLAGGKMRGGGTSSSSLGSDGADMPDIGEMVPVQKVTQE